MGLFSQYIKTATPPAEEGPDTVGQSLRKGWDAGVQGAGSQLNALAGAVGEAAGFDEFAKGRYQASKDMQAEAARVGPQIRESGQVTDLRSALNYGAGVVGGSAPVSLAGIAAGAATGGAAVPAVLASSAAMAPFEIGDVVQRQQADPAVAARPAGERLRDAVVGGGVSAVAQGIVPSIVGGKLVGRGAETAAKRSVMQSIGHNVVGDAAMEGATEGVGEGIKQFATNQDAPLDYAAIKENAIGGAVGGGAMGGVGLAADLAYGIPKKGVDGAKNAVTGAARTAQEAFSGVQGTVESKWAEIQPQIASGMAAVESGAKGAWDAMPDSVKGVGEFLKTSFEDQIDTAAAARKRIMESDDVPAEIKQAVAESKPGMAAQRAYVWAVDQTRAAAQKAQPAAESAVGKVRGLLSPQDDTEDRILSGKLMGDEDITTATPEAAEGMLSRSTKTAADWVTKRATELMNRADISQEKRAEISQLAQNAADAGSQAAMATISKGVKLRDSFMSRWDSLTTKLKEGVQQGKADSKKSEDFSGYDQQIVERIAPILERTHPYLMDSDDPKTLRGIGATLRMFISAASEGKMELVKKTNTLLETALGKDAAHEVLDSLHEMVTGNEQISNYFAARTEMLKESKANATLEELIRKHQSAEAPNRSGLGDSAAEMAHTLRRWARGEFSGNKPRSQVEYEDAQLRMTLQKHFGTKTDSIFRALDREMEVERKESGVKKNQLDSDEALADDGTQADDGREVESGYLDSKGRRTEAPELYTHPDKDVGKGGYAPKSQQALLRFKAQRPDARVYFVSLKEYGKARGMSESQMTDLAGGANPSDVGYFKAEQIKDDDSLRDHELRRMRMNDKYVKNKEGEVNPAAIMVPGTTTAYDSKRIANVMHKRATGDWSDFENAHGMRGRMAQKFAEGIAELTAMHGKNLEVRDDQVIADVDGVPFTWGEAQALLKKPDTIADTKMSPSEEKLHEVVPTVDDATLRSSLVKLNKALNALVAPIEAKVKEDLYKEFGWSVFGSNKSNQQYRELQKRIATATSDEETYIPAYKRLIQRIDNELEQRSGEDRRSAFLATGTESRDGIEVKRGWTTQLERYMSAKSETDKSYMTAGKPTGRTEGDPEGQIHDAAATVNANDLIRHTQHGRAIPDARLVQQKVYEVRRSNSPMKEGLANRLDTLARSMPMMTEADQNALRSAMSLSSLVDLKEAIDPIARKYADRIVPPGVKVGAKAKTDTTGPSMTQLAETYSDYVNNPPADFSVARAQEIAKWARTKEAELKAQAKKLDELSEEYDQLDTQRFGMRMLAEKAEQVVASENDARETDPTLFGSTPNPKAVAAKKAAFLEKVASGDQALIDELRNSNDAKGLQRAAAALDGKPSAALDAINERLSELVQNPDVAYGLQTKRYSLENTSEAEIAKGKFWKADRELEDAKGGLARNKESSDAEWQKVQSLERKVAAGKASQELLDSIREQAEYLQEKTDAAQQRVDEAQQQLDEAEKAYNATKQSLDATAATGKPLTEKGRKQILSYLNDVTPWVQAQFPFLAHAGEFTKEFGQAIVRVSAHALNPMSVAHHESLHAFFDHLRSNSAGDVADVVTQTASKPAVVARLRELLAHSPEAQAQLADAEERAAYMYQFWAAGDDKLIAAMGDKPTTLFSKIADALRKVLGMWTNDERALHILEYFNSGEYGKRAGRVGDAYQAMMDKGRNHVVDQVRDMGGNLMEMGEAVFGAGAANMRDSGIPALSDLADLMKRRGTDEGRDAGFIPAARLARAKYMQQLAESMGSFDEADLHEAQEALQHGTVATTAQARQIQQAVRKTLDDLYLYLGKSGVQVADLGVGKDYYPRRWDVNYLSKNKDAFMAMARKYPDWHDPEQTYNALVNNDGSELHVVDRPGMASKQTRHLAFIDAADAAPFMSKNLLETVNSYVTQATRRAEWSRRLGDGNSKLEALLERAKTEGATDKQIEQAKKFIAGVNGTLGDDLNPTARRVMGNMIVYQNIRLLPMAIFSSIVDPMGIAVRGGKISDAWSTFKRGIREIPAGLKGEEVGDYYTQVAETMGVVDNAMMHAALGASYTQGVVSDTGRKLNDMFFKYNLMEQFGRSMRVGATEAALKFLEQHSTKPSTHSERWLAELGLTAKDVKLVDGRVALTEADGLSAAQAAKMRSAVNRWVDGAVLRPDAADKPVWMNDPRFMLISHLKQFVYSFQHTVLSRVVHEYRHGNMAPALALTSYVPIMLVADTVKGLVQGGGDEPEWKKGWTATDYLSNAVERAGLFGVGQFAIDTAQGQWGSLTGPTLEQFVDGASVLGGSKQFKPFALHSLPANSLYAEAVRGGGKEDVTFAE